MGRHQIGRRHYSMKENKLMQNIHNLTNGVTMSDELLEIAARDTNSRSYQALMTYISKMEKKIEDLYQKNKFLTDIIADEILVDKRADLILKYPEIFLNKDDGNGNS